MEAMALESSIIMIRKINLKMVLQTIKNKSKNRTLPTRIHRIMQFIVWLKVWEFRLLGNCYFQDTTYIGSS